MKRPPLLFLNVLIVATCGLIYELLAGTLASYVLGDSVTQFSLIIGIYLFAMGVGSWLSGFIDKGLARRFVDIELAVAILGGFSAPLLFISFSRVSYFYAVLYFVVFAIGVFVGLEIPLLLRILKDRVEFKQLVSRVLAFDYIGALLASILFPILFVPRLGLIRTSLVFGMLNAGVAMWGTWLLRPLIKRGIVALRIRAAVVMALLLIGLIYANKLTSLAEDEMFADEIVYTKDTPYQRIVITRGRAGFQLFLNGNLQFSSTDEYRYHEALVHPAMLLANNPKRVVVLGGGDGLALREVLKYPSVERVTLVDLDPDMTNLSSRFPLLANLNQRAFNDPRVQVINEDAFIWIEENTEPLFDAAIVDFPDPNSFSLGKLYTTRFYRMLRAKLAPDAAVSVQSTSPMFARNSYWCIIRTLEAAGFVVRPYYTAVPSFGLWGFALARTSAFEIPRNPPAGLRFLDDQTLVAMFTLRNTLQAGVCDVVMGIPAGYDSVLTTPPYYRSTYVFVYLKSAGYQITSFDAPLLRTLKIGVHLIGDDYANSPPAHLLSTKGIVENVVGYSVYGDYGEDSPPGKIITAIASREIDVAIVWGPIAGYFAKKQIEPLSIIPVPQAAALPSLPFSYNIALGVRRGNETLRTKLTELLQRKAPEIKQILSDYGVPTVQD